MTKENMTCKENEIVFYTEDFTNILMDEINSPDIVNIHQVLNDEVDLPDDIKIQLSYRAIEKLDEFESKTKDVADKLIALLTVKIIISKLEPLVTKNIKKINENTHLSIVEQKNLKTLLKVADCCSEWKKDFKRYMDDKTDKILKEIEFIKKIA